MLLALVIRPLTAHPFRDGAPFLLLTETSNIWTLTSVFSIYRGGAGGGNSQSDEYVNLGEKT